jgi:asparagine synthase (glutamine-hydrolysing)
MCGFSGVIFASRGTEQGFGPGLTGFRRAARRVAHRGDTDHRELIRERLWLSHFRLAFQDVASGIQPMRSGDGKQVIVFNGEVYNHLSLRPAIARARAVTFRTRSDTETLIEGWKAFGEVFFESLEGEYAFLIVDLTGDRLVAHRDRYGVKPLFLGVEGLTDRRFSHSAPAYHFRSAVLEIASEIKGLASPKSWCRDGLLRQFVGLYEPICTPFEGIFQIPPGGVLSARRREGAFHCTLSTFSEPVRTRHGSPLSATESELEEALRTSVTDRLLSDVELGVYLSGGIDSKAIAFELARQEGGDALPKAFTVGFEQPGYDETEEACAFADYLGLRPHVIRIDGPALDYAYPQAVHASELVQPYTNGAAKWWLSLFARESVQGVLTGDGADELLCGYPSFRYVSWWKHLMWKRGMRHPRRRHIGELLEAAPLGTLPIDALYLRRFSAHAKNPWLAGSSAEGTGDDFVASLDILGVQHPLFGQIRTIAGGLLGDRTADEWLSSQADSVQSWFAAGVPGGSAHLTDPLYALLLWQNYFVKTHLPVLILNWVGDRMEMANTLEGRTPFLSNRLRRLVQSQPDRALVLGLRDKVLLRRTYRRLLPDRFVSRPKKQFNAPLLSSRRLVSEFDTQRVFERVGIGPADGFSRLQRELDAGSPADSYRQAHMGAAVQTSIALSILHRTLVEEAPLPRDARLEAGYLKGRASGPRP